MADRIAIKRLTASDCTLFAGVYKKIDAGNQKSINLNADILTGHLYPNLAEITAESGNEIAISIAIYGPNGKSAHKITRKIIKGSTYKNWRLNGEVISGPIGDPERYDYIIPNDLTVMAFHGTSIPTSIDIIIISQNQPSDSNLYHALNKFFSNRSMIVVTSTQIAEAANESKVDSTHPILIAAADPTVEAALEDATQGGLEGTRKLLSNKNNRQISSKDFAKAKVKTDIIGQDGEGIVNLYLASLVASGKLKSFRWVSAENPISPFDFECLDPLGQRVLIDAKSTPGPFENVIHLSLAQLIEASGPTPYKIYRVYQLGEDRGKLRISDDLRNFATYIKQLHENHMPSGVRVDSFSITTTVLTWGVEIEVVRPDEES